MSGCTIGGAYSRPGSTVGPPLTTQRETFCGPRVGFEHSYGVGVASSGVEVLKFQR
jgi:hypothetical protein